MGASLLPALSKAKRKDTPQRINFGRHFVLTLQGSTRGLLWNATGILGLELPSRQTNSNSDPFWGKTVSHKVPTEPMERLFLYTPSSSSSSLAKVWHKVKRVVECLLGQNHYIRSQVFVSILLLPILLLHILLLLLLKYGTRRIRWRGWQSTNWLGFLLALSRLTALYFSTVFLKCISRVYSSSVFLYFSSLLSSVFLNLSYCCIYNSKENWLGSHSFIALHYAFIKCIFVFSILKVF